MREHTLYGRQQHLCDLMDHDERVAATFMRLMVLIIVKCMVSVKKWV